MKINGAFAALLLAVTMAGCADSEPYLDIMVVDIIRESHQGDGDGIQAQVSYNVTVHITNIGPVDYRLEIGDWSFNTDSGLEAAVHAVRPPGPVALEDSWTIAAGDAKTFEMYAFQIGSPEGNLTSVSFRDGPPRQIW